MSRPPQPGKMEAGQTAAVHQRAAAPGGHAVEQAERAQAVAVQQSVVAGAPQGAGKREGFQCPVIPDIPAGAAGNPDLLPFRRELPARERPVPQRRHWQSEEGIRQHGGTVTGNGPKNLHALRSITDREPPI